MKAITTISLTLTSFLLWAQPGLPPWGKERFKNIENKYMIAAYIKPQFLEADFSGDNKADLAVLIERKLDGKKGILILFGQSDKSFIVGAGSELSHAGDNFEWAGTWRIFSERTTTETTFKPDGDVDGGKEVRLNRTAISISEEEGSGGLIYFDGRKFIWIHQGD